MRYNQGSSHEECKRKKWLKTLKVGAIVKIMRQDFCKGENFRDYTYLEFLGEKEFRGTIQRVYKVILDHKADRKYWPHLDKTGVELATERGDVILPLEKGEYRKLLMHMFAESR